MRKKLAKNHGKKEELSFQQKTKKEGFPKIGLRNIKTAISATLCAVVYLLLGRNPTFACIGAVFGMDNNLPSSLRTGGNRLKGTIIGGLLGIGLFSLLSRLPFPKVSLIALLFVGIIVLIYISQLLKWSGAIQAGAVVFYIVMLNTPQNQIQYALNRILDTAVGVTASLLLNWAHFRILDRFRTEEE